MRQLASCFLCLLFTVNITISQAQESSTFGNFYTPKGKLKILVVCVSRMGEITILQDFPAEFEYVINTFEMNHENEYIKMEFIGDSKLNNEKLKVGFVDTKHLSK